MKNGIAWQNAELIKQEKYAGRHVQGGRHDGDHARRQRVPRAGARQGAEDVRVEVGRRAPTTGSRRSADAAAPLHLPGAPAPRRRRARPCPDAAAPLRRTGRRLARDRHASAGCSLCVLAQVVFRYFLGEPADLERRARALPVRLVRVPGLGDRGAAAQPPRDQRRSQTRLRRAVARRCSRSSPRSRRSPSPSILGYYGMRITLRNADVETTSLFFTMGVVYAIVPVAALAVGAARARPTRVAALARAGGRAGGARDDRR